MEENKEVVESKKNKTVPIIIMLIGVLLIGGGATFMILNNNQGKEKEKEDITDPIDEHEVSEELLKKLVRVAFIETEGDTSYESPLDDVEGNISELELKKQVEIVVNYAKNNNMAEAEKDASKCPTGEGDCYSMTSDAFKKVLKLYGLESINASEASNLAIVGDKYLFKAKEQAVKYSDAMHNYFSMKMMDEIIINDNIHIMNIDPEKDTIDDTMINKEYLFRKYEESDDYYLYSVRDNSPKDE